MVFEQSLSEVRYPFFSYYWTNKDSNESSSSIYSDFPDYTGGITFNLDLTCCREHLGTCVKKLRTPPFFPYVFLFTHFVTIKQIDHHVRQETSLKQRVSFRSQNLMCRSSVLFPPFVSFGRVLPFLIPISRSLG